MTTSKLKTYVPEKNIYKVKMQATDQQKVSASCRKDKELEPRVNKELLKYRGEKKTANLKGKQAMLPKSKLKQPTSQCSAVPHQLRCE